LVQGPSDEKNVNPDENELGRIVVGCRRRFYLDELAGLTWKGALLGVEGKRSQPVMADQNPLNGQKDANSQGDETV